MARSSTAEILEAMAAEIGENLYMDIAKWHLYLESTDLHTVLAERLYPLMTANTLQEDQITQVLNSIPIKVGGGKREIPLTDFLPVQCQRDLMEILQKFQREI